MQEKGTFFAPGKRALSLLPEKGHFGKLGGACPPGSYTPAKNKTRLFSDNDIIDEIKNATISITLYVLFKNSIKISRKSISYTLYPGSRGLSLLLFLVVTVVLVLVFT